MRCVTSRFPPNLGKIATPLYKIIGGVSQTHIISNLGLGRRLGRAVDYPDTHTLIFLTGKLRQVFLFCVSDLVRIFIQ